MADRVDEFLYRGFIPEENRGGTYHVVLNIGGKLVGPLTPEQATAKGFDLPAIIADINAQAINDLAAANTQIAQLTDERDNALAEASRANAALQAQAEAAKAEVAAKK